MGNWSFFWWSHKSEAMETFWPSAQSNDLYCCSLISFHSISVILQRHFSKFFFLINLVSRNASFTSCSSFIFHWFPFLISFWFVWPPLFHCCSICFLGARNVRILCLSQGSVRGLINDCCPNLIGSTATHILRRWNAEQLRSAVTWEYLLRLILQLTRHHWSYSLPIPSPEGPLLTNLLQRNTPTCLIFAQHSFDQLFFCVSVCLISSVFIRSFGFVWIYLHVVVVGAVCFSHIMPYCLTVGCWTNRNWIKFVWNEILHAVITGRLTRRRNLFSFVPSFRLMDWNAFESSFSFSQQASEEQNFVPLVKVNTS